ncbi:MAG TPA: YgaP-like transmembrane domain [Candidatus Brocadiia bacterium]
MLVSLILAYLVTRKWLLLTGFVCLSLFQSAFTNWCPMMWILRKFGVK